MEDERPKLGDIGPLLPDASDKAEDKKLYDAATNKFPSSIKPVTVTYEDNLDFGGYQPSCVGKSPPSAGRRRIIPQQENKTATESKSGLARVNGIGILGLNSCSDIFTPKSGDNKNESTATQPKPEKMKDDTTAFWEQPCGPFHEDSMDAKDVSKRSFQTSPISSPLQQVSENIGCQKRSGIYQEDRDVSSRRGRCLRGSILEEKHAFQLNANIEKENQVKERESLFPKLNEALSVKDSILVEKSTVGGDRQKLEENTTLKEEIIKLENEKRKLEKEAIERKLSYEGLSKRLTEERDEAQRMSSKLASEVQFLKSSAALSEEKITSLQNIHGQETEMLKAVHARELEAKDNQLAAERTLLIEHKSSIEKLSELIAKAHEWSTKVVSLEEAMFMEREHSNNDKHKWLDSLEKACHEQQASLQEWGRRSDDIFKKVEGIVATLEKGTKETEKDHINLQSLQEAVQAERLQSLAEVTTAREKLEEVRNSCYQEKEEFLMKIMQKLKKFQNRNWSWKKLKKWQLKLHMKWKTDAMILKCSILHLDKMFLTFKDMNQMPPLNRGCHKDTSITNREYDGPWLCKMVNAMPDGDLDILWQCKLLRTSQLFQLDFNQELVVHLVGH